ncbi:MAG: N-methyl-L-tryptophan oxidase [Phycisphaerae bacterium]|nr:N-methyl-L-tryptophan oxidase [Phycisphaerae bacterium]
MSETYDVIVIGCGAMGSASAFHLARRGAKTLVLEQYDIGHEFGSSHGRSRVIRKAYFEDPRYVPLLHRSYELWRALERKSGETLLHLVGCLNIGPRGHVAIEGVLESVRMHGLPHELLTAEELQRRWAVFSLPESDVGIFEPEGGFVSPERCIRTHAEQARRHGAVVRTGERVVGWSPRKHGLSVRTESSEFHAGSLVITAGPWLPKLAAELNLPLRVERQVQLWFLPDEAAPFTAARMPSFIHFVGTSAYYGIPMREREGVKVARHHAGETTSPDAVNRLVTQADVADVRSYSSRYLPAANGPLVDGKVCLYTNTPDDHFIIDRHPRHEQVLIAGGFSGHGFKFAPIVGSALADMAINGGTNEPIDFLSIRRFSA